MEGRGYWIQLSRGLQGLSMTKPKEPPTFDLDGALPTLVSALQTRRVLKKTQLKGFKVPASLQEQVLARLGDSGYEAIKGGVRVPLRVQLENLLTERTVLSGPLGKQLHGATAAECKALLADLARTGRIQLLIRGKVEAITAGEAQVLSREEMRALA
jgi:hypothetical protein